eukprot:CAMPEP_0196735346 /NCGR_PEP_ID=MMETSP1091-20130531/13817_1 /TAXON_ID=302021 /ORGANISM="Rhodomonas sp., Strain CCMP768" /LENGTH=60 /DNA_ID=CAMNT_0042078977 /DNA_START=779 /DNA_END=957 /DNA_ORIENTATION=-
MPSSSLSACLSGVRAERGYPGMLAEGAFSSCVCTVPALSLSPSLLPSPPTPLDQPDFRTA